MKGYIKELQISGIIFTITTHKQCVLLLLGVGKEDAKSTLLLNSTQQTYEVSNPLETLLCSLAACENITARFYAKENKFEVKDFNFSKIHGSYDTTGFFEGGENNIIKEIEIQAEIETNISEEEFEKMHEQIQKRCPVYQMLIKSGVQITSKYIQKKY